MTRRAVIAHPDGFEAATTAGSTALRNARTIARCGHRHATKADAERCPEV